MEYSLISNYPRTPWDKTSACDDSVSAIFSSLYRPIGVLNCWRFNVFASSLIIQLLHIFEWTRTSNNTLMEEVNGAAFVLWAEPILGASCQFKQPARKFELVHLLFLTKSLI